MDNGQGNGGKLSAKEFTEAIDRATDAMAGSEPEVQPPVLNSEQSSADPAMLKADQMQIGRNAIYSTGEVGGVQAELEQSTEELERDQDELTHAERFVGEESALQTDERLADDAEDLRDEQGQGIGFVGEIMGQSQTEIASVVMNQVNKIVSAKSFHPEELVRTRQEGMHGMIKSYNRRLGDRN